jgi:hypothetical protein
MGWGVETNADIYVPGVRKDQIENEIEKNDDLISTFEREILMLVSSTPRDVVSDDVKNDGDIIFHLRIKVEEILESYKDCIRQNTLLDVIKDNIDKAEDY